jgi:Sec-independent protein secretion pathway component TatC
MVPLVLLYELGIFLSVFVYKGKARREQEYESSLEAPPGALSESQ